MRLTFNISATVRDVDIGKVWVARFQNVTARIPYTGIGFAFTSLEQSRHARLVPQYSSRYQITQLITNAAAIKLITTYAIPMRSMRIDSRHLSYILQEDLGDLVILVILSQTPAPHMLTQR
ncbi:unnamed protein product [Arctia plantaginis]|uniref:Uncharacterized protein n=1 Tax=Arctia plantaginis TaxID=874455 RepID=A0A8S1AAZ9_ARCPL|nr:unnamed protein product [Arctia plantaginis]